MYRAANLIGVLGAVSAIAACTVTPPSGPSVMALPLAGKSLDVFQRDDRQCRDYASTSIGYPRSPGAQTPAVANNAGVSSYDLQDRYDVAYTQCMYSLGDTVRNLPRPYAYYDYAGPAYPWYDGGWPGFVGTGFFAFDRFHHFHHGFHDGFHGGFHNGFHGGFHGGGGHGHG